MEVSVDASRERADTGQVIEVVAITAQSTDPFLAIFFQAIEDPLRDEVFPGLYPPDDTTLRLLMIGDLTNLAIVDSQENQSAIREASDDAVFRNISGYRAAQYSADLGSSSFGRVYVRGAFLVTERRDITLMTIGGTESGLEGSVSNEFVDNLWSRFVSSLQIDF